MQDGKKTLTSIYCQTAVTCEGGTTSHFINLRKISRANDNRREVGSADFAHFLTMIFTRNTEISMMAFRPFAQKHVYEKQVPKEKEIQHQVS